MHLFVFNNNFVRIGILDNYISLTWEEYYQDIGKILLVANDTEHNIRLLRQGNILYQPGKDTAMRIAYAKYDSRANQVTVHGFAAMDFLTQRIVDGTENIYNAERSMYNIVGNNLRGLPDIALADAENMLEIFDTQYTGGSVPDALNKIAVETGLGYKMLFDYRNKRHLFKVYRGEERMTGQREPAPVIFSDEFGNLANMTITDDMSVFKNVAYVAGAGEGEGRKIVVVGAAEGLERYELWVDARDIQPDEEAGETVDSESYIQKLITRGIERLNEHIHVKTFQAEVDANDFRTKYNLGDIVTCKSTRYGVQINTRIMHYKEITEQNITKLTLTLGNPEITFAKGLMLQ